MSQRSRTSDQIRRFTNVRTGRSVTRSTSAIDTTREAVDIAIADVIMNAKRAEQAIRDKARKYS